MPKITPARLIALIIFIYSLLVIYGWIFNVDIFVTIVPNGQPMAFITAFSFLLSAIALWFIQDAIRGNTEISLIVLPATTMATLLLMITLIAASIFGAYTGITDLFLGGNIVFEPVAPGMPAIMTVLGFAFFDAASIHSLFADSKMMERTIYYFEILIIIIGVVAVLGYTINIPLLTYKFTPTGTGMALNTALTFILLGTGVSLADRRNKK